MSAYPYPQITFKVTTIDYVELNYTEFTGGVESEDFFAYCVYVLPQNFNADDLARLRYVFSNLFLVKIENVDPTDSHDAWNSFFNLDF